MRALVGSMTQMGFRQGRLGWSAAHQSAAQKDVAHSAAHLTDTKTFIDRMLPLYFAHQGLGVQEAGGTRLTSPQQLISLRPGANVVCRAVSSIEVLEEMKDVPASESFIRPHLRKLAAYTPIEPFEVLSKRLGRDALDIVKLDANENPYGPPPEVLEALGSMPFPNIYPDPETRKLRAALAETNNIPAENLLVGCGADELIDLLMRCVLEPGDLIVDCPPTFTMYAFDAAVNGADVITIPRLDGFRINAPAIAEAVKRQRPKMVFLTSPNNPDGSMIAEEDLLAILKLPVLVVLDEAYIEFSQEPSRLRWVLDHPNLVIFRTFSKSAGLAGLRVGWGAFPANLIEYLWRAKQPYNVSVAAETAACAALTNPDYLQRVRDALVSERQALLEGLQEIPFLQPYPSHANFILCKVVGSQDAKAVKDALAMEHGIMVRHYAKKELSGYIRISVGRPEDSRKLLRALQGLCQPGSTGVATKALEKE